jgi:hypothetical protein
LLDEIEDRLIEIGAKLNGPSHYDNNFSNNAEHFQLLLQSE